MKTFIFKPSEVGFSGEIELRRLMYEERLEALDELNIGIGEDGKVVIFDDNMKKTMIKLLKLASKFYVRVDLVYDHEGVREEYKSYEDLSYDYKCQKIIDKIAVIILNNDKLGNV